MASIFLLPFCFISTKSNSRVFKLNDMFYMSTQKEECTKKIRELGSLPADAFDKHQKTPVKTVC